jgi:hypothetical protein
MMFLHGKQQQLDHDKRVMSIVHMWKAKELQQALDALLLFFIFIRVKMVGPGVRSGFSICT